MSNESNKKVKMEKNKTELSEEQKRKKALRKQKKQIEEQNRFEEALDELLEDPQMYELLKKLKD
jgi:hypothetical protein